MATTAHHIRSDYDPEQQRDFLLAETGQICAEELTARSSRRRPDSTEDGPDPWTTESTFGARRRIAAAPRFVPARIKYDEWGNIISGTSDSTSVNRKKRRIDVTEDMEGSVAGWYRQMTSRKIAEEGTSADVPIEVNPQIDNQTQVEAHETVTRGGQLQETRFTPTAAPVVRQPPKSNWFTSTPHNLACSRPKPPPQTLADILARSPPPEKAVKPPIFLHLGPENKGWSMLERSGWREGEGLGVNAARMASSQSRPRSRNRENVADVQLLKNEGKNKERIVNIKVKQEELERGLDRETAIDVDSPDVGTVQTSRESEVIDLTLSDSEADEDNFDFAPRADQDAALSAVASLSPSTSPEEEEQEYEVDPSRMTLLTPLRTTLKADKLGIGHRDANSKRAVTHGSSALKAHIKDAAALKKQMREHGRGRRGWERKRKREAGERKGMLAYLNT